MVKKIIATFLFLIILVNFNPVISIFAQEATISASPVEKEKTIDYPLPYPGLLPDHPLYFLKTARDKVVGFFILDPLEKAEFSLHQADKKVQASLYLIENGESQYDLSRHTFSKAFDYFESAIVFSKDAKEQGISIDDFSKKLILANKKHQQVLLDAKNKIQDKNDFSLEREEKRVVELGERAKDINQDN